MPTQITTPRVKSARDGHPSADQTTQLVAWLDEERRRDKAKISEMLEQLGQHYTQISGLARSVQDLEGRLTRLQTLRQSQIDYAADQAKSQVQLMVDQYDIRYKQSEEEAFRLRQAEREREDQILAALQLQVEALQQWQNTGIGDHDLLLRLDLNQTEMRSVFDQWIQNAQEHERRLLYVEDWLNRSGQLMAEMHQLSERMRAERAEAAESNRRAEQQRARHMAEWGEQIKQIKNQMEDWLPGLKEGKKHLAAIQESEERLKQLEPRLLQWQKLVDEGRRKDRDQMLSDVEKRWQQQLGEWQFLRDEWSKKLTAMVDRVAKLEDWRTEGVTTMHDLMERMDRERRERLTMISDVLKMENELDRQRDKLIAEFNSQIEGDKAMIKKRSPGADSAART